MYLPLESVRAVAERLSMVTETSATGLPDWELVTIPEIPAAKARASKIIIPNTKQRILMLRLLVFNKRIMVETNLCIIWIKRVLESAQENLATEERAQHLTDMIHSLSRQ
jgi:hypothetical protein